MSSPMLVDPVDDAEAPPAQPISSEEVLKILGLIEAARDEANARIASLRARWAEEPMRQTFTKLSLYDEYSKSIEESYDRLRTLALLLQEHKPEPEAKVECKQCPKMIPLSLVRAHKQWHLQVSMEDSEEKD